MTLVFLLIMKAIEKMYEIVFPKMELECTMILDRASDDDYSGDPVPLLSEEVVFLHFHHEDGGGPSYRCQAEALEWPILHRGKR